MMSVEFWTKLIKVTRKPPSEQGLKNLDIDCTHVTGQYYIFEGDLDGLRRDCEGIRFRVIEEGAVGALGGLSEDELKAVCLESYGVRL